MKKFVIALIMALMSVAAFGQIEHKTDKYWGFHYYEIKIGEYVFTANSGIEKTAFVKEPFYIERRGVEDSEVQKVCEFIDKNKAAIEKKYGIMIDVCIRYSIYHTKNYNGTLLISIPKDYEAYELVQKQESEKRAKEKESRLNSLNSLNI